MVEILVFLVVFCAMIFAGYGLYLALRQWELRSGICLAERKSIFCFYEFHSWRTETATFSTAEVCSKCGDPKDELKMERLKYEQALWQQVPARNATPTAAQEYVESELIRWDRARELDSVMRARGSAEAH